MPNRNKFSNLPYATITPGVTTSPIYFRQPKYMLQSLLSCRVPGQTRTACRCSIQKTISITAGDACTSLLTSLTELINHLVNVHLSADLWPFLYSAQLHGLCQSNRDLRPITVGCTYQCLAAKVCLRPYISRICQLLLPSQVGEGTLVGCEVLGWFIKGSVK